MCNNITSTDLNRMLEDFTKAILASAKNAIPRGKRKEYKPYWSKELEESQKQLNHARDDMEKDPTSENTANATT